MCFLTNWERRHVRNLLQLATNSRLYLLFCCRSLVPCTFFFLCQILVLHFLPLVLYPLSPLYPSSLSFSLSLCFSLSTSPPSPPPHFTHTHTLSLSLSLCVSHILMSPLPTTSILSHRLRASNLDLQRQARWPRVQELCFRRARPGTCTRAAEDGVLEQSPPWRRLLPPRRPAAPSEVPCLTSR